MLLDKNPDISPISRTFSNELPFTCNLYAGELVPMPRPVEVRRIPSVPFPASKAMYDVGELRSIWIVAVPSPLLSTTPPPVDLPAKYV